jgi:hypothetical protein
MDPKAELMARIKQSLTQELVTDLGAGEQQELKCVEVAVGKHVGVAYGAWRKQQTATAS